ncbi:MAG: hypothetical protein M3P91_09305 [Actinomycetota bacterium]|nr:hypothetical protein [Actinomycetota bacterium]
MLLALLTLLFPLALMALMLGMERVERRLFPKAEPRPAGTSAAAAGPAASAAVTPYAEDPVDDHQRDLAEALDN